MQAVYPRTISSAVRLRLEMDKASNMKTVTKTSASIGVSPVRIGELNRTEYSDSNMNVVAAAPMAL